MLIHQSFHDPAARELETPAACCTALSNDARQSEHPRGERAVFLVVRVRVMRSQEKTLFVVIRRYGAKARRMHLDTHSGSFGLPGNGVLKLPLSAIKAMQMRFLTNNQQLATYSRVHFAETFGFSAASGLRRCQTQLLEGLHGGLLVGTQREIGLGLSASHFHLHGRLLAIHFVPGDQRVFAVGRFLVSIEY